MRLGGANIITNNQKTLDDLSDALLRVFEILIIPRYRL